MIKSTFTFVPGIGKKTEETFWQESILTWNDLSGRVHAIGLSRNKIRILEDYLGRANGALQEYDASFFAEHLAQREYWRLYKDFMDRTLFLDIETTGLSRYYDKITLIGAFDGCRIAFFIRDNNLEEIIDYMKNYELIVTFNGKLFDIPFIKKELPKAEIPPIHLVFRLF